MDQKLLVTDLDNTLYDWVTFFSASFQSMVSELARLLDTSEDIILAQFKAVHQRYGNSEQPFAVLELPLLREAFPHLTKQEKIERIDPALRRFNSTRKRTLSLYAGVSETLAKLQQEGVKVVGHTEAIMANSYWRLRKLGIEQFFSRLYTLEGREAIHVTANGFWADPPDGFVAVVPREERKPNPTLLLDICKREGVEPTSAYYVGDSLVRDIAMAKEAGVKAIWAAYGLQYDPACWALLVRITHWTEEDVAREKDLKEKFGNVLPDHTINAFSELGPIIVGAP